MPIHTQNGLLRRSIVVGSSFVRTGISSVTQFIRTNPIVSGGILGGSVLVASTATGVIRRRRARRATSRSTATRRKRRVVRVKKRKVVRKRVTHRSPRHKGHKRVSFINKKTGKRVSFLVRRKGGVRHTVRRRRRG